MTLHYTFDTENIMSETGYRVKNTINCYVYGLNNHSYVPNIHKYCLVIINIIYNIKYYMLEQMIDDCNGVYLSEILQIRCGATGL